MTRKVYLIIIYGILGIVISYLLFSFVYISFTMNRLKTIEGESDFDITTILNISKDRITTVSETYNKKEFMEYDCVIDSIYYVSIVNVGKVSNMKILDSLYFNKYPFSNREGWFNYDITSPHPMTNMLSTNCIPSYNVFLMPFMEVEKVNIFFEGNFTKKEYLNNATLSYSLNTRQVFFSFNSMNKTDLHFFNKSSKQPLNIFLSVDENNNLYIGCGCLLCK